MTAGDAAQRRDVVCPLCGYETVLFEAGDQYCPDCFAASSGPTQSVLRRMLKLRTNPLSDPVTATLREAVIMVRQNTPSRLRDQIVITTSNRIKRAVIVENERFVKSPLDLNASFNLDGVPIIVADESDQREAKVYADVDGSSAKAVGGAIASSEQIEFPEEMLTDE